MKAFQYEGGNLKPIELDWQCQDNVLRCLPAYGYEPDPSAVSEEVLGQGAGSVPWWATCKLTRRSGGPPTGRRPAHAQEGLLILNKTRLRRGALRAKPPDRVHDPGTALTAKGGRRCRIPGLDDVEEDEHVGRDLLLGPALLTLVKTTGRRRSAATAGSLFHGKTPGTGLGRPPGARHRRDTGGADRPTLAGTG